MFFTLRKKLLLSLNDSLGNQKWFFNGIDCVLVTTKNSAMEKFHECSS